MTQPVRALLFGLGAIGIGIGRAAAGRDNLALAGAVDSAPGVAGRPLYDVLAEKNPKVRMITVNQAGHFHFREYPEEFDYNVINFINYWQTER